jgi:hypothetical protein
MICERQAFREAVYGLGTVDIVSRHPFSIESGLIRTCEKYVSITLGVTAVPTEIVLKTIVTFAPREEQQVDQS